MGLLCSKCGLKSFEAGKAATTTSTKDTGNGTIEIRNAAAAAAEKATHFGSKFTRRKVAKKRPVISTPRPINPLHLNGRKWQHVIVTIPIIEDPPIAPTRKKRKNLSSGGEKVDTTQVRRPEEDNDGSISHDARSAAKKMSFFEIMSAIQLRRCIRVLGTAAAIGNVGCRGNGGVESSNGKREVWKRAVANLDDLFYTFLRGNETAIMVFAAAPLPAAFNIDYTKNRSLTNEPNDSFFDNANVCGGCGTSTAAFAGYRFKKNFILLQPAKRDLDKLKFCKICQPPFERINANCIEIRGASLRDSGDDDDDDDSDYRGGGGGDDNDAKNEESPCPYYVFVTRRNINRRVVSITSSSSQHRARQPQQSYSLNVKNISNKTNQKPNNMYSSSNANIEKVSTDEMKKTYDENAAAQLPPSPAPVLAVSSPSLPAAPTAAATPSSTAAHCRHIRRKNHLTISPASDSINQPCISDDLNKLPDDSRNVSRLNSDQCCTGMKNFHVRDDEKGDGDGDQDRDSDTSCSDSLTEFTYSLGT